ncbi:GH-E family nuclease [uncultured Tessaracoccus sp.]|uniref:GH-E family nuclease n=1 Tax=uncultured Tessaracoccus sp. TaxID=905023 RepID=UPI0025F64C7E|nr:GH-E family nuclease [uncultured Tessaracoccus sp.]
MMAKRYPPEVVDLANGGMFRRVVGRQFNYKRIPETLQGVDEKEFFDELARRDEEAAKQRVSDKRKKYVGSTPSKWSDVGRHVLERMHDEDSSQVKNMPKGSPDEWTKEQLQRVKVRGEDGKWYPYSELDMGHYPIDAVVYWNNVGRFHGPQAPEVREWMNDPDNYLLQPGPINQSDGRIMGSSGFGYQPPVTLPDGVDITEIEGPVLEALKDFKGDPVDVKE